MGRTILPRKVRNNVVQREGTSGSLTAVYFVDRQKKGKKGVLCRKLSQNYSNNQATTKHASPLSLSLFSIFLSLSRATNVAVINTGFHEKAIAETDREISAAFDALGGSSH